MERGCLIENKIINNKVEIIRTQQRYCQNEREEVIDWDSGKNSGNKIVKEYITRRYRKLASSLRSPLKKINGCADNILGQDKRKLFLRDEIFELDKDMDLTGKMNKSEKCIILGNSFKGEDTIPN